MSEIRNNLIWFYNRYATDNGLTLSQAEQRVSQFDLRQWKQQVDEMKQENLEPSAKVRIKALIKTAGINKHYLIYAMVGLSVIKMINRQDSSFADRLTQDVRDESNHLSMTLKPAKRVAKHTKDIIDETVDGTKWSELLWNTGDKLNNAVKQAVDDNLRKGMTLDDINSKLFPYLKNKKVDNSIAGNFKQAEYVTKRLIRTESARVKFTIDKEYYKANGVELLDWVTEPGACNVCVGWAEGGPYEINFCPNIPGDSHPSCRCSIVPHES